MTSAVNIVELGNDNSSNLDGRVVHLGLLRSWNTRSWWCRAVLADEAFLDDLTRENCGLLIQQDFQNATYYPSGQMTSASVLTFVDENSAAGDSFLQMLQNTYRNTRRKDVSDLRFTVLFLVSSTAPCVLEFPNEKSYWETTLAIKQSIDQEMDRDYIEKCKILSTPPATTGSATTSSEITVHQSSKLSTTTTGLFNLVTGRNGNLGTVQAGDEWQDIVVSSGRLSIGIQDSSYGFGASTPTAPTSSGVSSMHYFIDQSSCSEMSNTHFHWLNGLITCRFLIRWGGLVWTVSANWISFTFLIPKHGLSWNLYTSIERCN